MKYPFRKTFVKIDKTALISPFYLFIFSDEEWEWVTTQWLSNWLSSPSSWEKVKNKITKCPHGKLRADDVVKMKCISKKGVNPDLWKTLRQ